MMTKYYLSKILYLNFLTFNKLANTIIAVILTVSFYAIGSPVFGKEVSPSVRVGEPILPVPFVVIKNKQKVDLGERLFDDKQLSSDNTYACRTCHLRGKGGADGEQLSPSIDGGYRSRNSPTILNIGLNTLLGWDGLPKTIEQVIDGVLKSKKGLASNWPDVIKKLQKDQDYVSAFNQVYEGKISEENIKNAMAEYLRSLNTPNARFDQYLRGDDSAITKNEKEGYQLFKNYGCSSCHQGVAIGGNMIAPHNIFSDLLTSDKDNSDTDLGRFKKTNDEEDKYIFRVPGLRNIALTAPYFHDGATVKLETTVDLMGRYMLGRIIPLKDRKLIVEFLNTLTGEFQDKPQ